MNEGSQMNEAFKLDDVHKVVLSSESKNRWALWKKAWIMNAAPRNDHDDALEPILVYREPYLRNGKMHESSFADFVCPRCGCIVGETTLPDMHIQGDDHYCADCGLRIDWQSASLKYEGRRK